MEEYLRNISFKSTEAVHPAASTNADKPPMSTGKRSTVNSKAGSIKTVQSVHHSPEKALPGEKLANASPSNNLTTPLTFALQPMDNPPTIEPMPMMKTVSKTNL